MFFGVTGQSLGLTIFMYIFLLINIASLVYMSVFDFESMEVPDLFSAIQIGILLLVNVILLFIFKPGNPILLWEGNFFFPLQNLAAGLIFGAIVFALIKLTKEKYMGAGDIRLIMIAGLLIGLSKFLVAFYATVFSALFFGLAYAIKIKKFHGVKIPFVPFIAFGTIFALFFAYDVLSYFGLEMFWLYF